LFDLATDPDCLKNLADDPALRAKMAALKETLFTQLKAQNDPRVLGRGDVFDQYPSPRVTSTDEGPKRKAKKKSQQ
jgi:hypothetical protein